MMAGSMAATPPAMEGAEGTPVMEVEFDQQFIDMAVPHHAAIVTATGAALIRLEHPELRAVALDIVLDQSVEVDKLRDLRQRLYGSSLLMDMDNTMISGMPGMEGGDPLGMAMQMDSAAMAQQMCIAPEIDLTFIDLTVAHHEVAVMMARAAMDQVVAPTLRAMAMHSIAVQQAQIAELLRIRDELASNATPVTGA
jgi:uncharacterized protein (DUF305 family)